MANKPEVCVAIWRHHKVDVLEFCTQPKYGVPRPYRLGAIRDFRFSSFAHYRNARSGIWLIWTRPLAYINITVKSKSDGVDALKLLCILPLMFV